MELVYLYAGNLGKCTDELEINFSKRYVVTYDKPGHRITIEDRGEHKSIFGENIQDINVLVGKNGVGKSTLMRLIGLSELQNLGYFGNFRDEIFDNDYIDGWFLVYHLSENCFAIEGRWNNVIEKSFEGLAQNKVYQYCIGAKYDFKNCCFCGVDPIDAFNSEKGIDDLFVLLFQRKTSVQWFQDYASFKGVLDYSLLEDPSVKKKSIPMNKYGAITKYLADSVNDTTFRKRMRTDPGTIIIVKQTYYEKMCFFYDPDEEHGEEDYARRRKEWEENLAIRIYGNNRIKPICTVEFDESIIYDYSLSQAFALNYLEKYIWLITENNRNVMDKTENDIEYENRFSGKDDYYNRKNYLLKWLMNARIPRIYVENVLPRMLECTEMIPDKYYTGFDSIEVPISEITNSSIEKLMFEVDAMNSVSFGNWPKIDVEFTNMSTGEVNFIDTFASIYGALKDKSAKRREVNDRQTCILLMDEPDMSFHPEWTRTFIRNLVDFLNEEGKDFDFQVIIATHSPLMLSDIPSESIFCLEKDENENRLKVTHPQYGMLSGLNDILIDSFFVDSLFGQFAEDYANGLIKRIEKWEKNLFLNSTAKAMEDKEYKELSEAINILGEGLVKASLKQRLERANGWYFIGDGPKNDQN